MRAHKPEHAPKLKKELNLFYVTLYGIGIILGAGIYAIIGKGAALAGNSLWLSFVFAAIIASFTGLSYAELSSMYPKTAAEYNYTKQAFRRRSPSFLVGWVIILAGLMSSATVSLGFAGYLSQLVSMPIVLGAVFLVIALSILNFIGIKESARFNVVSTLIEFSGLLIIIILGIGFIGNPGIDYFQSPQGLHGTMAAVTLIFFAFIGFEDIVNISEETRNAQRIVPKALLISLAVCTVLYILVALSVVSILPWEDLAASEAPLADVAVARLGPVALPLLSFIALFATGNTVLIMLIATSRVIYGIARDRALPKKLSRIHPKRRTPYVSIFLVMVIVSLIALSNTLESAAKLTNISIFMAYLVVNLSVIKLRYSRPGYKRPFRVPLNIGRFPLLPALGVISCLLMLSYFDFGTVLIEIVLISVGYLIYTAVTLNPINKFVIQSSRWKRLQSS